MKISPALLYDALDAHRANIGRRENPDLEPISWREVANRVGTHGATFTRLKAGNLPGQATLNRILLWLGQPAETFIEGSCPDCAKARALSVIPVPDAPADAICGHAGCDRPPTHGATLSVGPGPDFIEVVGLYCAEHVLGHDREYTVTGNVGLPVAPADTSWDGAGAQKRVFEKFTKADGSVDTAGVAQAYLYRDPDADPETKAAYKLPFADVIDGALKIVPQGVTTAAAVLAGGRGGVDIPDSDRSAVESRVCTLYDKAGIETDCPFADASEEPTADGADGADGEHGLDPVTAACRCGCRCGGRPGCPCQDTQATAQQAPAPAPAPTPTPAPGATTAAAEPGLTEKTAAIVGTGRLSDSEDPETQAAITRVSELLRDGAVGVSIAHDMNPDDMPSDDEVQALIDAEDWEGLDALFENITIRPRHVAIVDTPAFADARMSLADDGTVTGPVTFEGVWTGDLRLIPYGSLVWEDVLPIPIIWDRHEGDHTGMTVGSITSLERVDGETSTARTSDEAVAAAASTTGLDAIPAAFFDHFKADSAVPVHIDAPDPKTGLRRIYGHAAPKGVCHRSDMGACFQYPADVDPTMRHFHTGTAVTLDNGETVRVGALTLGGLHLDTRLAKRGVNAASTNRHREDANEVFALVRAWADDYGLAMSGVVVPGVPQAALARAMASAPSVELWPEQHGRTLVGIHLVPTPAWPVAAAAGSAMSMTAPASVVVDEPKVEAFGNQTLMTGEWRVLNRDIEARLDRIEKALALLVSAHAADGIDLPEPMEEPA